MSHADTICLRDQQTTIITTITKKNRLCLRPVLGRRPEHMILLSLLSL